MSEFHWVVSVSSCFDVFTCGTVTRLCIHVYVSHVSCPRLPQATKCATGSKPTELGMLSGSRCARQRRAKEKPGCRTSASSKVTHSHQAPGPGSRLRQCGERVRGYIQSQELLHKNKKLHHHVYSYIY